MSTYTIIKSYRIYEGQIPRGEPVNELNGVQLLGWLKESGYSYQEAESMMRQADDRGSIKVQLPK